MQVFAGAALSEPHFPPPPPSAGPAKASRPAASLHSRAGTHTHTRGLVSGCTARGLHTRGFARGVGVRGWWVGGCAFNAAVLSCVLFRALFPVQTCTRAHVTQRGHTRVHTPPPPLKTHAPLCSRAAATGVLCWHTQSMHIRAQTHCSCSTAHTRAHPLSGSTNTTRVHTP